MKGKEGEVGNDVTGGSGVAGMTPTLSVCLSVSCCDASSSYPEWPRQKVLQVPLSPRNNTSSSNVLSHLIFSFYSLGLPRLFSSTSLVQTFLVNLSFFSFAPCVQTNTKTFLDHLSLPPPPSPNDIVVTLFHCSICFSESSPSPQFSPRTFELQAIPTFHSHTSTWVLIHDHAISSLQRR